MKTAKDIYQESLIHISLAAPTVEIAGEILRITEALRSKKLEGWTADQISRAVTKLAVLRVNLGQELADAVAYYDISYANRKIRYANDWTPTKQKLTDLAGKATQQDIENDITKNIEEDILAEVKQKHYAERLRTLYNSTETLITALQTRLSVLKQERAETRYQ